VAAADLYRPKLENDLQRPNTKLYPGIAATLATMAKLHERGCRSADFALYMACDPTMMTSSWPAI
jgi:hypothetical protein